MFGSVNTEMQDHSCNRNEEVPYLRLFCETLFFLVVQTEVVTN